MLVSEFKNKAMLLYAAVMAGDAATAMMILWELVGALIANNPIGMLAAMRGVQNNGMESLSEADMIAQLKNCCDNPPVAGNDNSKLEGPFIDLMRPILVALLKKWLGI